MAVRSRVGVLLLLVALHSAYLMLSSAFVSPPMTQTRSRTPAVAMQFMQKDAWSGIPTAELGRFIRRALARAWVWMWSRPTEAPEQTGSPISDFAIFGVGALLILFPFIMAGPPPDNETEVFIQEASQSGLPSQF
eukprot:g2282.t1